MWAIALSHRFACPQNSVNFLSFDSCANHRIEMQMHTNQVMNAFAAMLENLETLKTEKRQLEDQGMILFDCWIAESKPGGTARTKKAHYQLRSRQPQFAGKKSKYLKVDEVGKYQSAIARGKAIRQLEKQIVVLQKKLERIEAIALEA